MSIKRQVRVNFGRYKHDAGLQSFCSWQRLAEYAETIWGVKPGERLVALNIDESGVTAVFELVTADMTQS